MKNKAKLESSSPYILEDDSDKDNQVLLDHIDNKESQRNPTSKKRTPTKRAVPISTTH
jgi:hypothetical protein